MNTKERAAAAKRLRADEAFQGLIKEIHEDAVQAFVMSAADDVQAREEAHSLVRAIGKIEDKLNAMIGAQTLATKKGQHRGSD